MIHNRLQNITKKLFFLLMMVLLGSTSLLRADEITIGDLESAANNSYLPMNSLYEYSYSQQIYTADEIGVSGTINSITMWMYGNANLYTMPFDIYMVEVDKEVFESTSDWVIVSESDIVYSGSVTVHNTDAEPYTFTLDTPFEYSGTKNLLIAFNNNTGSWKSGLNGKVNGASGDPVRAIYARRDSTPYDIANLPAATSTTYQRNVIVIDIEVNSGTRYMVSAMANPEYAGIVEGTGYYYEDTECVLYAYPSSSAYYFVNWSDVAGSVVSTEPEYVFTVTEDVTYIANFEMSQSFEVEVYSALDTIGIVTGEGVYFENELCTVFAAGDGEYLFDNWTLNGEIVSTNPTYTFEVTDNVTLVANFVPFESTILYDGAITNSGVPVWIQFAYEYTQSQCVMPAEDLTELVGKSIKGLRFYVTEYDPYFLYAQFRVYMTEYPDETITSFMEPATATTVYYGMLSMVNNEMTITFDTPYDYFGGNLLIGINTVEPQGVTPYYTKFYGVDKRDAGVFTAHTENINFSYFYPNQSNFLPKTMFFFDNDTAPAYSVTAVVEPEGAGYVEGEGVYVEGHSCTLKAYNNQGYSFVNWTIDGDEVSTDATYTFEVTEDVELVANFEEGGLEEIELTVYDGTSTLYYLPINIFYFDEYTRSQYVIPSEDLTEMVGGTINAIKYYSSSTSNYETGCMADIYLKEVDYTIISAFEDKSTAQVVYTGTIYIDENSEVLINFDTPYEYKGGNLLIGSENLETASWKSVKYYGSNVPGASIAGQNSTSTASVTPTQRSFIPKTTFYAEVTVAAPEFVVEPEPIDLGYRPNGAWMQPLRGSITNLGGNAKINDLYVDNDYFQFELNDVTVPFALFTDNTVLFNINHGMAEEGEITASLNMYYNDYEKFVQYEVSAIAYDPVDGDVWETAIEADLPYTANAPAGIYKNYNVPGGSEAAVDAVYKVTVDELSMLNASTTGADAAIAVYPEGFMGIGGPDYDNIYQYSVMTGGNGDTFFEGFEDSGIPEGWWTIDADGDGYNWCYGEEYGFTSMPHNGVGYVKSASYINNIGVLYPDNYLVTPMVNIVNGSTFSFWACSRDTGYAYEYFGVAVGDASGNFTMVDEWTMTAKGGTHNGNIPRGNRGGQGNWYQYVVDLSEFAGQTVNIAIRHFNCADQYWLIVDDVELTAPGATNNRSAQAGTITQPLNPGTYYVVVSSTDEEFPVNMSLSDVPAPVMAQIVYPVNEAVNVIDPCNLVWNLGDYTQEMQVLFGTTNPPTDVLIDWTDELVRTIRVNELEHNTVYYMQVNERNNTGTTEGEVITFTSYLDVPVLYTYHPYYAYEGEDLPIYWNQIEDEAFLSYNVYLNDTLIYNTIDTEFTLVNPAFNLTDGYYLQVTAVYTLGESDKSGGAFFYVSGYGNVEGAVYEQDDVTTIAGATVYLEGTDVFGRSVNYEFTTNEEGFFNGPVAIAQYYGYAYKEGYQIAEHAWFSVDYNQMLAGINFVMNEAYTPVAYVNAEEVENNAEVTWGMNGDRSFQYYRVYRASVDFWDYNNITAIQLVADSVFAQSYTDAAWDTLDWGPYRYGVSAIYQGNYENPTRSSGVESFENGLPDDWAVIDADGDGHDWMLGSALMSSGFNTYDGADMMCSQSYDNSLGALNPDNYLVTPLVELGSTFSFWACAQDASYAAEHFGVAVSTSSQTDANSFTTLQEWTISAKGNGNATSVTRSGNRTQSTWYQYSVDLSAFAGQTGYIAIRHFNCTDMFYLNVDYVEYPGLGNGYTPAPALHESSIIWSDIIDKDMYTTMSIGVTLNGGDSPAGTEIEIYRFDTYQYDYLLVETVILDETGVYTWDNFRRGDYYMNVNKDGYNTITSYSVITEPTELTFELIEFTESVTAVYVSPTGWAMWDDAMNGFTPPTPPVPDDIYWMESFENGIPEGWSTMDFDGDGHDWMLGSALMSSGFNTYDGAEMMCSQSYDDSHGALNPDNYLITPQQPILGYTTFSFWACAQDASYPAEHFGVAVSSDGYNFTTINEWTISSKGGGQPTGITRSGNRSQTGWNQYTVDLSMYAGRELYIAIRHFNCTDWYYLDVDYVEFSSLARGGRHLEGYEYVMMNEAGEVLYEGTTTEQQMQLPVEELEEGALYFFEVAKVYSSGTTESANASFIYSPCENYEGAESVIYTTTEDGNMVTWNYEGETNSTIIFNLYDTYGDGWNGGYLTVTYGDGYIDYITCDNGSQASFYYQISGSQHFKVVYTGGSWQEENYFEVVKENGEVLVSCNPGTMYTGMTFEFNVVNIMAMVIRDGEFVEFVTDNYYLDPDVEEAHEYSIRVVYPDYAMSCEQEAEFKHLYNIVATANEGGLVNGEFVFTATVMEDGECILYAEPFEGYVFNNWTDAEGEELSTDPFYSFIVEDDAEFFANFVDMSHYFIVDPYAYENSMTVTGIINIDGVEQENMYLEIGALNGDECRGAAFLTPVNIMVDGTYVNRYFVFMTIYGNPGDELDFMLYDHYKVQLEENLMCTNEMFFDSDYNYGTMYEPYEFNFMEVTTADYEFTSGWNWWSTHIELSAINGLEMLEEGLGENAAQISSQTAFTDYYAGYGWYGSLTSINNESMYRIQMNNPTEFTMVGPKANPEEHPITIVKNWNHIGYISDVEMSINDALADMTPLAGDMVKSQKAYANYYEGYGWYGSLNTVKLGDGLMYKSVNDQAVTFTYPVVAGSREIKANLTGDNNHWVPEVHSYPNNMTVLAVVELNDNEIASDNYELAAFANGECRGSIQIIYSEPINRYVAYMTVAGDEVESLTFGLYNTATGEECFNSTSVVTYSNDAVVGNPGAPFVISFNSSSNDMTLYPNPVMKGETVRVMMANDAKVVVEITNALGKVVSVETVTSMSAGITAPEAAGVYTVRIISESNDVKCQKLVVR